MKANELRIGNYVLNHHNELDVVTDHTFQKFRYPKMDGDYGVYPIELIEEWLVKFGFVLKVTGDDVYEQEWHIDGQMLIWGPTSDNGYCHDFHTGGHIQSVHQLQNLYFALTGEELTIKDTIE